ncbi:HTH-type transcriptional regulator CynR [Pigmentiphaga humi]|uniref:HTH-type transcriptional regulator CynR n=1 Tax=Pigmentiphaga humi TaxID=2478468 RepID=A0A3P4B381_9BURK|nr:LysR family transcriptional regulator [Pigmentiphaga humi]VCU70512.1 HTH-type transcriptional regulator CynR [Pigmentiphaga humi]
MNITLRQVRAFVHVYQLGSLTRAAARMSLTQAAVSVLVRQFEEELGVRLFDRTTRTLKPTQAAVDALGPALDVLAGVDRLGNSARGTLERTRGRVTFAATPAAAAAFLPAVLKTFAADFPAISVTMRDMAPRDLVDSVVDEAVEFSIGTPGRRSREVALEPLIADYLCLICRRDSPLSSRRSMKWKAIEGLTTIAGPRGSGIRDLIEDSLGAAGVEFSPTYEAEYLSTALAMTEQGLGVAILPSYLVDLRELFAIKLTEPVIARDLFIVTKKGRSLSPAAESLIATMKAHVGTLSSRPARA